MLENALIGLFLIGGCAWLAFEFARQLYEAAIHGTIRSGRSNNRRIRRDDDPGLFRNNVIAAIVLYALFAAGGLWLFTEFLRG